MTPKQRLKAKRPLLALFLVCDTHTHFKTHTFTYSQSGVQIWSGAVVRRSKDKENTGL